ncbi:MAG: OB-fold domain-containing protein [Chloroflexota bacterium]|nr:OB-fold domain-containing protein [Dehalococcoidia bacterium]MDW8253623.1 OB-fold domain-containing protein [Chloroflexota bacterium]
MAVGILSFGAHIPRYRLARNIVGKAWGSSFGAGERAVANFDEDALTMAVSAAEAALAALSGPLPDAVFFASNSSPYHEKQGSTLIAAVCGLPRTASTLDVTGSHRAGTAALKSAFDAIRAGSAQRAIVAASEVRVGEPGSDLEQTTGDGAVAFVLGEGTPLATFDGIYSLSEEFTDIWRTEREPMPQRGDTAFVTAYGYQRIVRDAIAGALQHFGLAPSDIARVAVAAPDRRAYTSALAGLGFPAGSIPDDPLLGQVGDVGSALPLLLLAWALEDLQPGDRVLVVSYGSGNSDVLLFRATDAIGQATHGRGVTAEIAQRRPLENYERFLAFRNVIEQEPLQPYSSLALLWKEQKQDLRLLATRCTVCGDISFPRQRICRRCRAKDQMEDFPLGRRGTVYTFTRDHLFPTPDPPTAMLVADLDGGGRFYGQMTDAPASLARIGLRVELTFRRLHEGGGYYNYFWKLRPIDLAAG